MSKLSVHQRKARDFLQREDWDNALSELERMLDSDGGNPTLHNQIGDVYLRKDEVQQACEHFERAIDLYAGVGLHNNAVALCKKVMRLRPGRLEVRYRLARLRLDQGFRAEAAAYFRDYLEHIHPKSESAGNELETRCREIVELLPDDAPVGKILEKLESAQLFACAFDIVRKYAQQAADAGDEPASRRYTEKMRSLRVLAERSGGRDLLSSLPAENVPGAVGSPAAAVEVPPSASLAAGTGRVPAAAALAATAPLAPAAAREPLREPADVPEIPLPEPPASAVQPAPVTTRVARAGGVHDPSMRDLPLPEDAPVAASASTAARATETTAAPVREYELPETSFAEVAELLAAAEPAEPAPAVRDSWSEATGSGIAPDASTWDEAESDAAAAAEQPGQAVVRLDPEPAPRAPREVPDEPGAEPPPGTNWVEALRRSPVWIPPGDEGAPHQPERAEQGSTMELEHVIDSFREQMARALDGDGEARYDLGVAYFEMGLYNEALAEFEAAARFPGLEVRSLEMLASCLLQQGRHAEVIELLVPVLAADGHTPRGRLGLSYALGLAFEALGDLGQARRHFEEVALVDIGFKDVLARLQRS